VSCCYYTYRLSACQVLKEYFLENRAITTDTVHDPANAIEADTLAHVLNERCGISMTGDKATNNVLNLDGHFFFPLLFSIIAYGF
jgi:hypothetical protein